MIRSAAPWLALAAATALIGWLLGLIGLPSPYLFGALVLGIAVALTAPGKLAIPAGLFTAAQAVTGVTLGTYLQSDSFRVIGSSWLPVTLVSTGTLALTLGAGVLLARATTLDRPTAALGMVAGGASGIVGMADELGADDRLVAFMQYLRVLVVVLLTPLLTAVAFPHHRHAATADVPDDGPLLGLARGWPLTGAVALGGWWIGRRIKLPAASLLGPLIIAGVITVAAPHGTLAVPPLLRETGFAVIGGQVGLRFTIATLREVGRLLVPVLAAIFGLLVACFALALLLAATTPLSLLDSYLATTPGGLYAVLAVAFGAGANTTFIIALQGLRLLVMVVLAPFCVRRLVR